MNVLFILRIYRQLLVSNSILRPVLEAAIYSYVTQVLERQAVLQQRSWCGGVAYWVGLLVPS